MGQQYDRYCAITAEGVGTLDLSKLRCRFQLLQWTTQAPNSALVAVTNPLPSHARAFLDKEYRKISIDIGYQNSHGMMFQGEITQATYGRETPTDTILSIQAKDNVRGHNYAVVSTTLPPGSTPKDHVDVAMKAMAPFGAKMGFIGVDLSKPVYPRSVTLWGMARDVLARVAKQASANVSYQNGEMRMTKQKGGGVPGGSAIVLNADTGLIGMPTQQFDAILARCLINPNIRVHSQVKIDQADIMGAMVPFRDAQGGTLEADRTMLQEIVADGLYTVQKIAVNGDTRGNPWYMDLDLLGTNATHIPPTPMSQYGVPGAI